MDKGDADAVGWMMWDIHLLMGAKRQRVDELKRGGARRDRAHRLNETRHADRNDARALVVAEWAREPLSIRQR